MSIVCEKAMPKVIELVKKHELEFVDMEYVKTSYGMSLNIYLDKQKKITLDDLEKFSKEISPILDEINITNDEPYNLSVSSPGLDRPFKTTNDYLAALNKNVEIKLYSNFEGKKEYTGKLTHADDKTIEIETSGKKKTTIKFARTDIASAQMEIKF